MKKTIILLSQFTFLLLGTLLLVASLSFGLAQTKWGKDKIQNMVIFYAKKQGIQLELEHVEGAPPLKWKVERIKAKWEDGTSFEAEDITIEIALFPLLKKQLMVRSFLASHISFQFWNTKSSNFNLQPIPPFDLSIKKSHVSSFTLTNLSTHNSLSFDMRAKLRLKKWLKEFSLDLALTDQNNGVHLLSNKNRTTGFSIETTIRLDDSKDLQHFLDLPFKTSLQASIQAKGSAECFDALLQDAIPTSPLSISAKVHIDHFAMSSFPFLERKWEIDLDAQFLPRFSIKCNNLHIQSNWLSLSSQFSWDLHNIPEEGSVLFSLSDLSAFNPYLPVPLEGRIKGHIDLGKDFVQTEISSPELKVASETYKPMTFALKSHLQNNSWDGEAEVTLLHPDLPWRGCSLFKLDHSLLQIKDFSLYTSSAFLEGNLLYDFLSKWVEGSAYVSMERLSSFQSLLPHTNLEGNLGGSFSFCGNIPSNLSLSADVSMNNFKYRDYLFESLHLHGKIADLLSTPKGELDIESKNAYLKNVFVSQFMASINSEGGGLYPFVTEIKGSSKDTFECALVGKWKQTQAYWQVDLDHFAGFLRSKPFSLQTPCYIYKSAEQIKIEPCVMHIEDGSIALTADLNKDRAEISCNISHVPLEVVSFLYPRFGFHGLISMSGNFHAHDQEVKGNAIVTLERAGLQNVGTQSALQAKGSLQVHFNPKGMQVHSHLHATHDQFLDWTATIPLTYSYLPFDIKADPSRPLSSELTMEGSLEEIFDFMNFGSHKATGLIISHLFLSQTLDNPALQGEIQLQNGSYENYYTGTFLQNISSRVQAEKDTLALISFQANDSAKGQIHAEGNLLLSPKESFPFSLQAKLENIELLRSETIVSCFNGHLDIRGDQFSAQSSGSLSVPKAEIQIFDELPYEIPVLPVVYKNRPIHLQGSPIRTPDIYPLYLDIELSSSGNTIVKGRGLSSEWEGDVHLNGTNTNLGASGTLSLIKGEYVFSGKTFNLTQGEISFSDKANAKAYIKINGQLQMSDILILAQMQGPLTNPTLTFHSIPHLPTSSILSMILFNKDISEITALQAIQLAQVIVSLSGRGGPDVLEAIRKSIGVDRLNIAGRDGTDEITVQIGWYLTHGVTVTLSQSVTSSDVTVEVDLKNGFIFQAETQNQEEGKFSIKWHTNY